MDKVIMTIAVFGIGAFLQTLCQNIAGIPNITTAQAFLLNGPSVAIGALLAWIWIPRGK
jgi:hypothetical protein